MGVAFACDDSLVAVANHVSCELGGEAVILNLDTGVYYGLEGVGAHVWMLLQQPRSLAEVRDLIVEEFEVDPAQCEADLGPFVALLNVHGLVRSCDPVAQ
jgi:hypothetical protein